MTNKIEQRIAAKAVIVSEGKVLMLRESNKYEEGTNVGRYDFPGGRVALGENIFVGLKREAKEEAGLDIEIVEPIYVGEWSPVIKDVTLQIVAIFFKCTAADLNVKLSSDHDDYQWVGLDTIDKYDLMQPNRQVIEKVLG
jgi:8-oxo-dGTP diphosphatase